MKQRHRHVADVIAAKLEALRHHYAGDGHLAVAALHRLRVATGARREDQHEQVVGRSGPKTHLGVAVRVNFGRPLGGIDVHVTDIVQRLSGFRVGEHQLAVGLADVAGQRLASPHRVEAHRHDPRHPGRDEHRREERRVFQQHTDVRRPVRVQPLAKRRSDRGAVLHVITPTGERVLEIDTAVVDVDQRRQQIGDRELGRAEDQLPNSSSVRCADRIVVGLRINCPTPPRSAARTASSSR